jgi:Xaa-Pro aminopeptidase
MNNVSIPFNHERLEELMAAEDVDCVVATSRHNVQYLLGGYRCFFFSVMDAIALSRYLPAVGYSRRSPGDAFYVGTPMERWQQLSAPLWVPSVSNSSRSSLETGDAVADALDERGLARGKVAVELPFLPSDSYQRLRERLPGCTFVDAVRLLEELRAVKREYELTAIRHASEGMAAAISVPMAGGRPGMTMAEIAEQVRRQATERGLIFDYCLATTGSSFDRAPDDRSWNAGNGLSVDSGGNSGGYIGDVARMAVLGDPTAEMEELLGAVRLIQSAATRAARVGSPGAEIYRAVEDAIEECSLGRQIDFEAHGIGLVSHEVPHLAARSGWPYEATDADRPLAAGMAISVETTIRSPTAGFVKLEDTVITRPDGPESCGEPGRGWIVVDC